MGENNVSPSRAQSGRHGITINEHLLNAVRVSTVPGSALCPSRALSTVGDSTDTLRGSLWDERKHTALQSRGRGLGNSCLDQSPLKAEVSITCIFPQPSTRNMLWTWFKSMGTWKQAALGEEKVWHPKLEERRWHERLAQPKGAWSGIYKKRVKQQMKRKLENPTHSSWGGETIFEPTGNPKGFWWCKDNPFMYLSSLLDSLRVATASLRTLASWQHPAHDRYSNKCGEKKGKTD